MNRDNFTFPLYTFFYFQAVKQVFNTAGDYRNLYWMVLLAQNLNFFLLGTYKHITDTGSHKILMLFKDLLPYVSWSVENNKCPQNKSMSFPTQQ